MLTVSKCQNLDYYEREVVEGRAEYLSEDGQSPGRWVGSLAASDGLTGPAEREALARAFSGLHPEGFRMTERELAVHGFDLTLSPSKSVSLIWALGSDADAHHVEAALYAARAEVERYLESTACLVRRGFGGTETDPGKGFLGAVFMHRTSRLGDPGIHLHWTIFNVTEGPDGRRTALDGRAIYRERYTAEAIFQATLRRELVVRLGLVFDEIDRHGVAEVAGVSTEMRRAFSRRRAQIVAEMQRLGVHSGEGARVATLNTRQAKRIIGEDDLRAEWRRRASDHRFDLTKVPRLARTPQLVASDDELAVALVEEQATFDRRDIIRAVAKAARQGASLDEILGRADALVRSDQLITVADDRWTTQEIIDAERSILAVATGPRHDRWRASPELVAAAVAARPSLGAEQRRMVETLCLSGQPLDVVVGRAGAGKTFTLDTVREAFEASGHRVIGASLAARAARELQSGSGIRSITTHSLHSELESGRRRLQSGDVMVIDEAGMLGTKLMASLVTHAHRADAKVILVGDPKQLPAVEAGGLFTTLTERLDVIELRDNRRQRDPMERFIVAALRKGLTELAVRRLDDHGRVTVAHNADALRDQLVLDWWDLHRAGRDVLMGAAHRSDADDLNERAHALLEQSGRLGPLVAEVDDRRFCEGDRVIGRRNRYDLGILNGELGTVVGADATGVSVELDSGRRVALPLEYVGEHLRHSYARTVNSAQGLTCEVGLTLGDDALYAELGYTALTRATSENRIYTVVPAAEFNDPGFRLQHLVAALGHSRAKTAAIDYLDPLERS